jgi:hypothetical protein
METHDQPFDGEREGREAAERTTTIHGEWCLRGLRRGRKQDSVRRQAGNTTVTEK